MSIEDMVEVESQADEFMEKSPETRERLLYIAILRTDRKVTKINEHGCAKACDSKGTIIDRWTPATIGTVIMGVLVGLLEFFRSGKGGS